MQVMIDYWWEE